MSCFSWPSRRHNHRIALDRLPDRILYDILLYLPFNQRVRIARVNRRFQFVSEANISQTKTFHFTSPVFQRITMESMAKVIKLCAERMEKLILHAGKIEEELAVLREWLQLLSGLSLPRLSSIIVETRNGSSSLFGLIQEVLVKIPSLRSLKWEDYSWGIDDTQQTITCESLEGVDLQFLDWASSTRYFTSVLNNCSNLKHLTLRQRAVECVSFVNRMDSLQSLVLDDTFDCVSKELLQKIPVSFPQLVNLEIRIGIQHVNPTSVLGFTRHSSQLRKLIARNIRGIYSETAASAFVHSLAGFVQQNLTIVLENGDSNVWQCAEVKSAFKEINQRPWRRLSIEVANVDSKRVVKVVDPLEWNEPVVPASKARKSRCQKMIGRILGALQRSHGSNHARSKQ